MTCHDLPGSEPRPLRILFPNKYQDVFALIKKNMFIINRLCYFRWLTLMLSQEFPLPDVLRIWDSLLSDETRSDFLIDVSTAMILVIRDQILINDFADNMKLLQVRIPPSTILHILDFYLALFRENL